VNTAKPEGENEIAVKDAYMQYKTHSGTKVSAGNNIFPIKNSKHNSVNQFTNNEIFLILIKHQTQSFSKQ